MALYCENCYILFEGKRCPVCGRKSSRGPEPSDPCFLTEKEQIWSEVLSDVLEKNGIPHLCHNVYGAGIAMKMGPMFERVIFYVKYKDLDAAREIVTELFSNEGEAEGETDG